MRDDPKLTVFGKGLLEDVAAKLSQLSANHDLEVISPRALDDRKVSTLADAKKEFGVNLGLVVSLKQDGDLVRAAYNLIDTSTDKNLAGDSITAPVSDRTVSNPPTSRSARPSSLCRWRRLGHSPPFLLSISYRAHKNCRPPPAPPLVLALPPARSLCSLIAMTLRWRDCVLGPSGPYWSTVNT